MFEREAREFFNYINFGTVFVRISNTHHSNYENNTHLSKFTQTPTCECAHSNITKNSTRASRSNTGTLEIVAANSIIDDDTHEWRQSKSSPHLQPYRAPAREYHHFGHTDGNRPTGFNAPGHVVPAVRKCSSWKSREYIHFHLSHL